MDRGAWWAIVHRVTNSRKRLKRLSTHKTLMILIIVTLIIIPPAWHHIYMHHHMECSQQSRDISTITTTILQISKLRLSHEEDSASS